jgi:hypothetical protein
MVAATMGIVADILRAGREHDRRVRKARTAFVALTLEEKGAFLAEALRGLRPDVPKTVQSAPITKARRTPRRDKTVREYVTAALMECAPLNVSGIHAVIERTMPGLIPKHTVTAAVSRMLAEGLVLKAGSDGRSASFTLASRPVDNGGAH